MIGIQTFAALLLAHSDTSVSAAVRRLAVRLDSQQASQS